MTTKTYSIVDTETGKLISVSTEDPTQPNPSRIISKLSFMRRFTLDEMTAVYNAAKSNTTIEVWIDEVKVADNINLDDADLVSGVNQLEKVGVIASGRALEILN